MSDITFRAMVVSKTDEKTYTREVTERSISDLPEGEVLVSKPVVKKEAVQKDLALESLAALRMTQQIMLIPQTATNATLWMIIGLVLMFVALVFGRRRVT